MSWRQKKRLFSERMKYALDWSPVTKGSNHVDEGPISDSVDYNNCANCPSFKFVFPVLKCGKEIETDIASPKAGTQLHSHCAQPVNYLAEATAFYITPLAFNMHIL